MCLWKHLDKTFPTPQFSLCAPPPSCISDKRNETEDGKKTPDTQRPTSFSVPFQNGIERRRLVARRRKFRGKLVSEIVPGGLSYSATVYIIRHLRSSGCFMWPTLYSSHAISTFFPFDTPRV